MTTNRLWVIGTIVLIFALIAGTWFIGVAPQLAAATKTTLERASVATLNLGHESTLATLEEQSEHIDEMESDLEDLRKEVPTAADQAGLIDQIEALAVKTGVLVNNIAFSDPTPYIPGDSTDPEVTAAMGSIASANFMVIPVTVSVQGTTAAAFAFLEELQTGTRLYLAFEISAAGTDEDPSTDDVIITIIGQVFVLDGVGAVEPEATAGDGTTAQ